MDPRLLEYYNSELSYLRELGQEFSIKYPKVASRLGMSGVEVTDPYVERLLEGFSFLTARIQLKMDAEFPRFSQRLLDVLYPNYLAPTPSMGIVHFKPDHTQGSLLGGYQIPRHASFTAEGVGGGKHGCEFRTAHDLTLWPLEIEAVSCTAAPPDLPLSSLPLAAKVKGALRIRIHAIGEVAALGVLPIDALTFYLSGNDEISSKLYELIFFHSLGVLCCEPNRPVKWFEYLHQDAIQPEGFSAEQSLLPYHERAFQGYRLLHEYFVFPHRFMFFTLNNLLKAFRSTQGNVLEMVILFDQSVGELETLVDKKSLSLFCTPVINLYPCRSNALAVSPMRHEHHVVMDRSAPMDFEVYQITKANAHNDGGDVLQEFRSFYASLERDGGAYGAYFSTRREPRVPSDHMLRVGARTNYIGSEVFIALVDQNEAPFNIDLKHLTVDALCSNRDLPLLISLHGESDLKTVSSMPVSAIKFLRGPTHPVPAMAENEMTWRLISHLNINYLVLTDLNAEDGAKALREMLGLYAVMATIPMRKQIESIQQAQIHTITRRLPQKGPIVYGRGVGIDVTVDESLFAGASPVLLGAVLEQFFARHVSINVFTETTLRSLQRGDIAHWAPRSGGRPIA